MSLKVWLITAVAALVVWGRNTPVTAQEHGERDAMMRLERVEQQIHRLAENQERLANRLEHQPGPQLQAAPQHPVQAVRPHWTYRSCGSLLRPLLLLLVIIHIMLAIWVFTDIRKRGEGSGIFIVLALLAGIPGTIVYALVRIGDRLSEKKV